MTNAELAQDGLVALIGDLFRLFKAVRALKVEVNEENERDFNLAMENLDVDCLLETAARYYSIDADTNRKLLLIKSYRVSDTDLEIRDKDLTVLESTILDLFKRAVDELLPSPA